MCLGVPMRILTLEGDGFGLAELDDTKCRVNLSLIENPAIGQFVVVHAGFAIERLDEEEAQIRMQLFKELSKEPA